MFIHLELQLWAFCHHNMSVEVIGYVFYTNTSHFGCLLIATWKKFVLFFVLQTVNEDEWKDYQEEERKDYTGLKLGLLQISDDDQLDGDAEGAEYGSDGEINLENQDKTKSGPWKKVEEEAEKPVKKEPVQEKAPVSSVYISPALRNAQVRIELC